MPVVKRACLPCIGGTLDGMPASLLERIAIVAGPSAFRALAATSGRMHDVLNQTDVQQRAREAFVRRIALDEDRRIYTRRVTLFVYPNPAFTHTIYEEHQNGLVYHRWRKYGGNMHGMEEFLYENGKFAKTRDWRHGLINGIEEEWFQNGNLSSHSVFVNDKRHGIARNWFSDGKIQCQTVFVDGANSGLEEEWYRSGGRHHTQEWAHGQRHGAFMQWHENGQLQFKAFWVDGRRHGTNEEWDANGRLSRRSLWVHGKQYIITEEYRHATNEQKLSYNFDLFALIVGTTMLSGVLLAIAAQCLL